MYEQIQYEVDGPSAVITLNRPEALNALTTVMLEELKHALDQAERDESVVGIVLTGAGRGFCAGMDMNALDSQASGGSLAADKRQPLEADPGDKSMGENFQVAFTYIMSIRKPIVAAVNGACAGLGMSIALLCDLRFGSENARFVTAFSQRGLIAEHGQSWILPRLLGSAQALDLLWSSRKLDAKEALELGLLNRILPQDELVPASKQYIAELAAACSPTSLMVMKQQVYRHLNMPLGEAMQETTKLMAESLK
ncbi:MAG: enoyl-CoA hydratase-related protein, partial [Pseudomonadales bacterium]